ncbi:hypothetical protein GD429_37285 [Burkholderia sp. BE17]|nr:hypothetical protein [Burkholderia sp. BE17]
MSAISAAISARRRLARALLTAALAVSLLPLPGCGYNHRLIQKCRRHRWRVTLVRFWPRHERL